MSGVWAIVPARGGSKGLPHKNLRLLAGRPLVVHAVDVARRVPSVGRVLVSTDDPEVAEVARRAGAEVPGLRAAQLAGDRADLRDVVYDVADRLAAEDGPPGALVVLYPTHPFRSPDRIEAAVAALDRHPQVSSAVPVDVVPSRCHVIAGGRRVRLGERRDSVRLFLPTGAFTAMLYAPRGQRAHEDVLRWRAYAARRLGRPAGAAAPRGALCLLTDPGASIDIDTPEDLARAEAHARGEAVDPPSKVERLPLCMVGLELCVEPQRAERGSVRLPLEAARGGPLVLAARGRRRDGTSAGPDLFYEVRVEAERASCRPLLGGAPPGEAKCAGNELQLDLTRDFAAPDLEVAAGRVPGGPDGLCRFARPLSARPFWSYDPDVKARRNELTGAEIRGRQDLPSVVEERP